MNGKFDKSEEIDLLTNNNNITKRAISEELEKVLYNILPVLDHGFVRVIDYMGNDAAITQAARVSYGKGTKTLQNDKALIRYLMKHLHTSPFEMCEIKLHIKAPIFIARQWVRHRTANINEYSGRYSLMNDEFYVPESDNITNQSKDNKQGRGKKIEESINKQYIETINSVSKESFIKYNELLNNTNPDNGLAREIARIILPLNTYTEFYWKIDLHNLLHFLKLRAHPHAQYEIRVYADLILNLVKKWVPITYQAFIDYRQSAINLSSNIMVLLKDLMNYDKKINKKDYDISNREWKELESIFGEELISNRLNN